MLVSDIIAPLIYLFNYQSWELLPKLSAAINPSDTYKRKIINLTIKIKALIQELHIREGKFNFKV